MDDGGFLPPICCLPWNLAIQDKTLMKYKNMHPKHQQLCACIVLYAEYPLNLKAIFTFSQCYDINSSQSTALCVNSINGGWLASLTWMAATLGGSTSPLLSPCTMTITPMVRVVIPQEFWYTNVFSWVSGSSIWISNILEKFWPKWWEVAPCETHKPRIQTGKNNDPAQTKTKMHQKKSLSQSFMQFF